LNKGWVLKDQTAIFYLSTEAGMEGPGFAEGKRGRVKPERKNMGPKGDREL
jgi:hypothetical protein